MAIFCKNCGGNVLFDAVSNTVYCESCGSNQPFSSLSYFDKDNFYLLDGESKEAVATYKRAVDQMRIAKTESMFLSAARIFDTISDTFNSAYLSEECKTQAEAMRKERLYNQAIEQIESTDPNEVKNAIDILTSLKDYKDSANRLVGSEAKLLKAKQTLEARVRELEKEKKRAFAKKKRKRRRLILCAAAIIIGFFVIRAWIYSPSNIDISFEPSKSNYVTEKYNGYAFNYNVTIENNGLLDVDGIEGYITIEDDSGETIVSSNISFNQYGGLRAGKTGVYYWELSINSNDTALKLYQSDFEELDFEIDITRITYTNGDIKTY